MSAAQTHVGLGRYLGILIGTQFVFGMLLNLLELAGINTPSSLGLVGGIIGTALAAQRFVRDQRRVMSEAERQRFATWGTVLTLAMGIAIFLAVMLVAAGPEETFSTLATELSINFSQIGLIASIAFLISYVLYYWSVGYFGRTFGKQLGGTPAG